METILIALYRHLSLEAFGIEKLIQKHAHTLVCTFLFLPGVMSADRFLCKFNLLDQVGLRKPGWFRFSFIEKVRPPVLRHGPMEPAVLVQPDAEFDLRVFDCIHCQGCR